MVLIEIKMNINENISHTDIYVCVCVCVNKTRDNFIIHIKFYIIYDLYFMHKIVFSLSYISTDKIFERNLQISDRYAIVKFVTTYQT